VKKKTSEKKGRGSRAKKMLPAKPGGGDYTSPYESQKVVKDIRRNEERIEGGGGKGG